MVYGTIVIEFEAGAELNHESTDRVNAAYAAAVKFVGEHVAVKEKSLSLHMGVDRVIAI